MANRLPQVHVLEGRVYSETEWEALCTRCGACCYESFHDRGRWVASAIPCVHLDTDQNLCRAYDDRFRAEPGCVKVSPSVVRASALPPDCGYMIEWHRLLEEDAAWAARRGRR